MIGQKISYKGINAGSGVVLDKIRITNSDYYLVKCETTGKCHTLIPTDIISVGDTAVKPVEILSYKRFAEEFPYEPEYFGVKCWNDGDSAIKHIRIDPKKGRIHRFKLPKNIGCVPPITINGSLFLTYIYPKAAELKEKMFIVLADDEIPPIVENGYFIFIHKVLYSSGEILNIYELYLHQ